MIGSGLGGLVAGALLAQEGRRVLVLEKNDTFGGAVGTFQRGPLTIEGSLHELDGLDENDPKLEIIQALGLTDALELVEVGDLYEMRSPVLGEPFTLPTGIEAAVSAATARFPPHATGIRDYHERIVTLHDCLAIALRKQDERLWWVMNTPRLPGILWPLARDLRRTLGQVLHSYFGDDEAVKLALCANLQYFTDDPDRMWFPLFAAGQASYQIGGGHYVKGGSSRLSEHLVSLIRAAGGNAQTQRRVTRILFDERGIAGVEHVAAAGDGADLDGSRESARSIFGSAAPHQLATMLPAQRRAAFMKPYARRPVSLTLWTLALGFDRKPSEFGVRSYSTWIFPDWMKSLDEMSQSGPLFGDAPAGRLPHFVFADYSLIDSGLPSPPYFASVGGLDLIENWEGLDAAGEQERKERWTDAILEVLDREFPGLAGAAVHRVLMNARNNEKYLNTPRGAIYGFAPQPPRMRYFTPGTPVDGLWLASAYGGFGGYSGAILSGAAAARAGRKTLRR
ncbi:MAG: NAD(P)/FAD-dependent oxidoreductase [Gaiellaceae bacterium]